MASKGFTPGDPVLIVTAASFWPATYKRSLGNGTSLVLDSAKVEHTVLDENIELCLTKRRRKCNGNPQKESGASKKMKESGGLLQGQPNNVRKSKKNPQSLSKAKEKKERVHHFNGETTSDEEAESFDNDEDREAGEAHSSLFAVSSDESSDSEEDREGGEAHSSLLAVSSDESSHNEGTHGEGSDENHSSPEGAGDETNINSDSHLSQFRAEYLEQFEAVESHSFLGEVVGNDDIAACEDGHKVKCRFDADSMVFVTRSIKDLGLLHAFEGITFTAASEKRSPNKVRVALSRDERNGFAPNYKNGKKPSTSPTLDQFPSFSAAKFMFFNHVDAYLSIHIIQSGDILGTNCPSEVVRTWNYAFNQTIVNYGQTDTLGKDMWKEEAEEWLDGLAGRSYKFDLDGNLSKSPPVCINGLASLFVLEMIFEILWKIAWEEWAVSLEPGVSGQAARLIVDQSIYVLQSAGFKGKWKSMQEMLGYVEDLPDPPVIRVDDAHSFLMYNEYLQRTYKEVYKRAHEFFFIKEGRRGSRDFSVSAFAGIDVASVFTSIDSRYNILPTGESSAHMVDYAAKARRGTFSMPGDDEHIAGDGGNSAHEERREEDTGRENPDYQYDMTIQSQVQASTQEDGTGYRDTSHLPNSSLHHGGLGAQEGAEDQEEEEDENEEEEDGQDDELAEDERLERSSELSGYGARGRFPLGASTGAKWGNHQQNHRLRAGVSLGSSSSQDDQIPNTLSLHRFECERACPIVQIYETSTRCGLQDKPKKLLRARARRVPKRIAAYFSELEEAVFSAAGKKGQKRGPSVFNVIRESFVVLEEWLERLAVHKMQVRYELTFASPLNKELAVLPMVPIDAVHTPLKCLSFVNRDSLHSMLDKHVKYHKLILVDGFCSMEGRHRDLKKDIPPPVVAANIAAAEIVALMLGAGAGSKGSLLERSLQTAKENYAEEGFLYSTHLWVVHPQHIIMVDHSNCPSWVNVHYGVDPKLCLTPMEFGVDTDNCFETSSEIFQVNLSVHEVEGLEKLRCPSQYRMAVNLIHGIFAMAETRHGERADHYFGNVDWKTVGSSTQKVETIFKKCAEVILALYKFELAERIVKAWKKNHPDEIKQDLQSTANENLAVQRVLHANTNSEISRCFDEYLDLEHGAVLEDQDELSSAEQIYQKITGFNGKAFPIQAQSKQQGWRNLAVPRCIVALGIFCKKVEDVPPSVVSEFGGRNPFGTVEVFQHFLAAALSDLGSEHDKAFLWRSRPSELRYFRREANCELVWYNKRVERDNLSKAQEEPTSSGSIERDSFVSAFLMLPPDKLKDVKTQLPSYRRAEFQTRYGDAKPCPCYQIILLQAYIIFFYTNKGKTLRDNQAIRLNQCSPVVYHMYPAGAKAVSSASKKWFSSRKFRENLHRHLEIDSLPKLQEFAEQTWRVPRDLVLKATAFLKSPQDLANLQSHENAWVGLPASSLHHCLTNMQARHCSSRTLDSANLDTALFICCCSGILTSQFFSMVRLMRTELQILIEDYHRDLSTSHLKKCTDFVDGYKVSGSSARFDFWPRGKDRRLANDMTMAQNTNPEPIQHSPMPHTGLPAFATPAQPQRHRAFGALVTPTPPQVGVGVRARVQEGRQVFRRPSRKERKTIDGQMKGNFERDSLVAQSFWATSVRQEDFLRLSRVGWLNARVVDYFLQLLLSREACKVEKGHHKVWFFGTDFFTSMMNIRTSSPQSPQPERNTNNGSYTYRNVRGWTGRCNHWREQMQGKTIFDLDQIIIPIHKNDNFWRCALVDIQGHKIGMYDPYGDSGGSNDLRQLLKFLRDEFQEAGQGVFHMDDWECTLCEFSTPNQFDARDSGVFACVFAEYLSRDQEFVMDFSNDDMPRARELIALSILNNWVMDWR